MDDSIPYFFKLVDGDESQLQPVYGIGFERELAEEDVPDLAGYRGMGPVRRGNLAWLQKQHDVYGSVVLASAQLFFDRRLRQPGDLAMFERLQPLGERAWALHDQPDAGLWEFRGRAHVHTYSAVMCWAACDRLARIAARFGLDDRTGYWRARAETIRERILAEAWNAERGHFADAFGGDRLDASLLLLADLGFVEAHDPRFVATVEAIGRKDEARAMFEAVLARRNPLGLLSEDLAFDTGEAWGNFPQTYSHVGLIIAAMALSKPWQSAV
jgi:GH15 family glucan-1,4-alpha-glucosidase